MISVSFIFIRWLLHWMAALSSQWMVLAGAIQSWGMPLRQLHSAVLDLPQRHFA